jgi:sugar diacid utilization regulator
MHCYDLFKLPALKSVELVAGSGGLSREIAWVYFADTVTLEESVRWVESGDLYISTGKNLNGDAGRFCDILPQLGDKKIAGILFNTGKYVSEIPVKIKKCADELSIPIFCLPWESKLVDMTKQLCNYIVTNERTSNQYSAFLQELLFNDKLEESRLAQLVLDTDFDFSRPCQIYYIRFCVPKNLKERIIRDPNFLIELQKQIHSLLQVQISAIPASIMITERNNNLILLADASESFHAVLLQVLTDAQDKLSEHFSGITVLAGAGRACTSPYDYKKSYAEAIKAADIAAADGRLSPIAYFEDCGLFSILTNVNNRNCLESFYLRVFRRILEYDKDNNANLYGTLMNLFDHAMNIQEVSDIMFLHKNTLKYRVNKIESLLGCSLHDPETIANITAAIKIGRLLGLQSPNIQSSEVKHA